MKKPGKFADFIDSLDLEHIGKEWEPEHRAEKPVEQDIPLRGRPKEMNDRTAVKFYLSEDDVKRDRKEAKRIGVPQSELYRAMREFYYDYFRKEHLAKYMPKRNPPPVHRRPGRKKKPQS